MKTFPLMETILSYKNNFYIMIVERGENGSSKELIDPYIILDQTFHLHICILF